MSEDRTYWHVPGARAWHARNPKAYRDVDGAICGYAWIPSFSNLQLETADRLPPTAHLCGNCARVIAARTDIELMAADIAEHGGKDWSGHTPL